MTCPHCADCSHQSPRGFYSPLLQNSKKPSLLPSHSKTEIIGNSAKFLVDRNETHREENVRMASELFPLKGWVASARETGQNPAVKKIITAELVRAAIISWCKTKMFHLPNGFGYLCPPADVWIVPLAHSTWTLLHKYNPPCWQVCTGMWVTDGTAHQLFAHSRGKLRLLFLPRMS